MLYKGAGQNDKSDSYFFNYPTIDMLPQSLQQGMENLKNHKCLHLYPSFWQWFMWHFGGFILVDLQDREYELISQKTGVPEDEIDNALSSYSVLFGGTKWVRDYSDYGNYKFIFQFPCVFRGVGANVRRIYYTEEGKFEELRDVLSGQYTYSDLLRWNNSLVELLVKHS